MAKGAFDGSPLSRRLRQTALERRLGMVSARDLPALARDLLDEGIDDRAVVTLAACDRDDDLVEIGQAFDAMVAALGLPVPADLRDAAIILRDDIVRSVLDGRTAPLVGGEHLWTLHEAFRHATRSDDHDPLGVLQLIEIVDSASWDEPRPREIVEHAVVEECTRILDGSAT